MWWNGTVENKMIRHGASMVELAVEAKNQRGLQSAFGTGAAST